jgi:hypothetical protein
MLWVVLQARDLLKSLMTIGLVVGFLLGCCAISVPWFFPQVFTKDLAIVAQVRFGADLKIFANCDAAILDHVKMAKSSPVLSVIMLLRIKHSEVHVVRCLWLGD